MDCEHSERCWRYHYSRYLQEKGYAIPPSRDILILEGYAPIKIFPKGGIACDRMPFIKREGGYENLCPILDWGLKEDCHEWKKEERRLSFLRGRQPQEKNHSSRPRVWISKNLRQEVFEKYHWQCVYCGIANGEIIGNIRVKLHLDHFIPLSQGGSEKDINNLVPACALCNLTKGGQFWELGCKKGKK